MTAGIVGSPTKHNNFDFVRVVAALLVLYSHQYALFGLTEPMLGKQNFGTWGVLVFFSISGFLVSQSWRNDPHWGRFILKRLLRIWPGLAVATVLTACVLGPLVSSLPAHSYFTAPDFMGFFSNLKLLAIRYQLPGVFDANTYPKAINGSLWTIPLEVRCYIALSLIGLFGLARHRWVAMVAFLALVVYYFGVLRDPSNHQYQFALYFFLGSCLDAYRSRWQTQPLRLLIPASILSVLAFATGADEVATLAILPACVIVLGTSTTPVLSRFGRFGDLSYGIYIYAFPVQQTLVWAGIEKLPFALVVLAAAAVTTACAYISWHLVERPALGFKPKRHTKGESPELAASITSASYRKHATWHLT
jgi:peptidoglycan/LPS O-acetylase OafA/YrhL